MNWRARTPYGVDAWPPLPMGPTRQQLTAIKNQSGVGKGDPPLWKQYGMTDLIANAICNRASSAYYDVFGMVYGVDEFRRAKYGELGWIGLIEGAGTRLDPVGGDITQSPVIGSNSVLTHEGNGVYRARLPSMSNTFFYLYSGDALPADKHSLKFWWRKTPGSSETGTLTIQGQDASNAGPTYLAGMTPPEEWTEVSVTIDEPGTSIRLAWLDSGGIDFQVRDLQFEQSPYPTSWIPPDGTARAAEDVRSDVITETSGAIMWAFRRDHALASGEQFRLYEANGGSADLLINVSNSGQVSAQIEGASLGAASSALTLTDWNTYTYAWNNGQAATYVNGSPISSFAATDPIGSAIAQIYGGPFASNRYLNGYGTVKMGQGRAYSDAEIAAISNDLLARLTA